MMRGLSRHASLLNAGNCLQRLSYAGIYVYAILVTNCAHRLPFLRYM